MPLIFTIPVKQESTPPLPANVVGWWDFSDASSLFTDPSRTSPVSSDGDTILGVTDKSGNGNHMFGVASPAIGPLYSTNIKNGLSVASNLAGSLTAYLDVDLDVETPHSYFVVARSPSVYNAGFGNSIIGHSQQGSEGSGQTTDIQCTTTDTKYTFFSGVGVSAAFTPVDTWRIWVFDMDGVDNPVYIENTFDRNNNAGSLRRIRGLRFMSDSNAGHGEWDSYGAELIMVDGAITTDERINLVNFLKAKWDI